MVKNITWTVGYIVETELVQQKPNQRENQSPRSIPEVSQHNHTGLLETGLLLSVLFYWSKTFHSLQCLPKMRIKNEISKKNYKNFQNFILKLPENLVFLACFLDQNWLGMLCLLCIPFLTISTFYSYKDSFKSNFIFWKTLYAL